MADPPEVGDTLESQALVKTAPHLSAPRSQTAPPAVVSRDRKFADGDWIRTISTWKISYASRRTFVCSVTVPVPESESSFATEDGEFESLLSAALKNLGNPPFLAVPPDH